jgi:hypothetical protein
MLQLSYTCLLVFPKTGISHEYLSSPCASKVKVGDYQGNICVHWFFMLLMVHAKSPQVEWLKPVRFMQVNLLASSCDAEEYSYGQRCGPFYSLGG